MLCVGIIHCQELRLRRNSTYETVSVVNSVQKSQGLLMPLPVSEARWPDNGLRQICIQRIETSGCCIPTSKDTRRTQNARNRLIVSCRFTHDQSHLEERHFTERLRIRLNQQTDVHRNAPSGPSRIYGSTDSHHIILSYCGSSSNQEHKLNAS